MSGAEVLQSARQGWAWLAAMCGLNLGMAAFDRLPLASIGWAAIVAVAVYQYGRLPAPPKSAPKVEAAPE